jgi:hypothetical protein
LLSRTYFLMSIGTNIEVSASPSRVVRNSGNFQYQNYSLL